MMPADKYSDIEGFINKSPELADARRDGVDLWALWHNLQRSPTERLRRHQIALDTYRKLQQEGIIDADLIPDDSGLTIDRLLQAKKVLSHPHDCEAVRQFEAIKKWIPNKNR